MRQPRTVKQAMLDRLKRRHGNRYLKLIATASGVEESDVESLLGSDDTRVVQTLFHLLGAGGTPRVVETSIYGFMKTVFNIATQEKRLFLMFGPTGCGKTYTSSVVCAAMRADGMKIGLMRVNELNKGSVSHFIESVCAAFNINTERLGKMPAAWRLFNILKDDFKTIRATLVIDEAQKMSDRTVELVRDMYDETGLSLILLGSDAFRERIQRKSLRYTVFGQFLRRKDAMYNLEPSTQRDVKAFFEAYGISSTLTERRQIVNEVADWGDVDTITKAIQLVAKGDEQLSWKGIGAGDVLDAIQFIKKVQFIRESDSEEDPASERAA